MYKLFSSFLVLILLFVTSSFAAVTTTFESSTDPSVYRTNTLSGTSGQGAYVNSIVPRLGYLTMVAKAKPADSVLVTGNFILYATLSEGAVDLQWIVKDVSGNITSGNVTGI